MARQDFSYPTLQDPAEEFRLLQILPGDREEPMDCKLTVYKRSCAPAYAAVSYEWGTGPAEFAIHLNGSLFLVRLGLYECLKELRAHRYIQHYWIDAISINQADLHERSAQVSVMGGIYRNATFVAAWVGAPAKDSSGDSGAAISFLKNSQIWASLYHDGKDECRNLVWQGCAGVEPARRFFRFLGHRQSEIDDEYKDRTSELSDEEYQEARDVHNEQELPHREVLASDAGRLLELDDKRSLDGMPKFITLVERHHGDTSCYDLRDKLYGLLGLDIAMEEFVPDYDSSAWDLYVRMIIYLQERYPRMPALLVSQVLQKALLIQSHEQPIYEAIRSMPSMVSGGYKPFRDIVQTVKTVQRVGAAMTTEDKIAAGDLETIRQSLGLQWTSADRSFSARDFSRDQKSMLVRLATRGDMFVSSAFNHVACSVSGLSLRSSSVKTEPYKTSNRFFLTTSRTVGLGCTNIAPGDTICQAFGKTAPMFVLRKASAEDESYSLVGRCYAWLFTDEYEVQMALEHKGVDLSNILESEVPDTYWAPQVTHLQPVREYRETHEDDIELHFDLETLAGMSSLAEYWICASNERWYSERTADHTSSQPFVGGNDRIKILVDTSLPNNDSVQTSKYPIRY